MSTKADVSSMIGPRPSSPGLQGHAAILAVVSRRVVRLWWLALPVLALTGLFLFSRRKDAVMPAFALSSAGAVFLIWCTAVAALMRQNDPTSAHLIPGQTRRLREVTLGVWIALATAGGLLAGLALGRPLLCIQVAAVGMLSLAACLRWPRLVFPLWVAPLVVVPVLHSQGLASQALDGLLAWHDRQPLTQTAAVLMACGAGLWQLIQSGGPEHRASWQQTWYLRTGASSSCAATAAYPDGATSRRRGLLGALPGWWREHLLHDARPTADSVVARAELAAMRQVHWSRTGSSTLIVFVVFLLAELAVVSFWPEKAADFIKGAMPGVTFALMSGLLNPFLGLTRTLRQTQREQAVLMLVPGMPRGTDLNRRLASRLFRHYLIAWSVGFGMVLLMIALAPGGLAGPAFATLAMDFGVVTLPAGLLLWRDWSAQSSTRKADTVLLGMGVILGTILCTTARSFWGLSPLTLMAGSALLTVVAGVWRWRALRTLPPFWPVGRHSSK